MSKSSFSKQSNFDDIALGWATSKWSLSPKKQKNALFDFLFTRFSKTSQKAARAVRDFVTCSSPQSSGFCTEDLTTNTSQESPTYIQDEIPSFTSNLDIPQDKHAYNGFIRHQAEHQDFEDEVQHPNHNHRKKTGTHEQAIANNECNLWVVDAKMAFPSNEPKLPSKFFELPTKQRLRVVKQFLDSFAYKTNSETSLQAKKQRPLCRLMATARRIVYKPEPIKSIEAVFLALYLTAGLLLVDRVPVSFKTKYKDKMFQHTVLLVQHNGKYGAFGINPNPNLMTKNLHFDSMSSIIESYVKAYEASAHIVLKIKIGLPVEHDLLSYHFVSWWHLCLSLAKKPWTECAVEIENHALCMKRLRGLWMFNGKGNSRGNGPPKVNIAKRKHDSMNFAPRTIHTLEKLEVKKPLEVPHTRAQTQAMPKVGDDDIESVGSNSDEQCKHCEQLKRDMPPSNTKMATLTTTKRSKTSSHHDTKFVPKDTSHGQRFSHSQSSEQQWEAESFESNTGDHTTHKPSLHFKSKMSPMSMVATKQILKNFVSGGGLSIPSRKLTKQRSCGTRQSIRKANTKLQSESMKKKIKGPLYNFTLPRAKSTAR